MFSFTTFGVLLLLLVEGSHSQTKKCPDAEVILPCTCKESLYIPTKFDCSTVTSNDELAKVFNREFSETDFGKLLIQSNKHLTTIRAGDLGNASFLEIEIWNGVLEEVEPLAFSGSYSTATFINLQLNQLVAFPFEEVPYFTYLEYLGLNANKITTYPSIQSHSLTSILFSGNALGSLPEDALQQLPNINIAGFSYCNLSTVLPGTFAGLPKLVLVDVSGNELRSLQEGTFVLDSIHSRLNIGSNMIDNIEPKAFTGVTHILEARENSLQLLEEEILRPSMDAGAELDVIDNPFVCGCDMAWLVLNSTLMAKVYSGATCKDGTHFIDLDPAPYLEC